jgi:hypothetical protein
MVNIFNYKEIDNIFNYKPFWNTEIQFHPSQKDYNRNKQQMLVKMWWKEDTFTFLVEM